MRNFISNIKADKWTFRGFVVSFLLTLLTVFYILLNYKNLPPFIPIFNQLPWGVQRLTQTLGIFIPIVVYIFIFFSNIVLTSIVYSKNPLIARMLSATTLLLAIMNLLFIIRTILVII